jgi:hypothetical protein
MLECIFTCLEDDTISQNDNNVAMGSESNSKGTNV